MDWQDLMELEDPMEAMGNSIGCDAVKRSEVAISGVPQNYAEKYKHLKEYSWEVRYQQYYCLYIYNSYPGYYRSFL